MLMVQEFGNFPRIARGAVQEYVCGACAVQFPAEHQAGCARLLLGNQSAERPSLLEVDGAQIHAPGEVRLRV